MPRKPTLSIPEGCLRPSSAADLDGLCAVLRHETVRVYLCDDTILPRDVVEGMLTRSDALDADGLGLWMIETSAGTVGCAGLEPMSEAAASDGTIAGSVEPLIALLPAARGRGLATAAVDAMAAYAKEVCRLDRLVAAVDAPNEPSHRLIRRCGFQEIGRGPGPKHTLVFYARDLQTRYSRSKDG